MKQSLELVMLILIKSTMKYFLVGVLAIIPAVIVIQILVLSAALLRGIYHYIYGYFDNTFLTILALTSVFSAITYIGYRISRFERVKILHQIEQLFNSIPMIRTIYRISKKLANLLGGKEKSMIKEIVLVEYPKEGIWTPAYVTNKAGDMLIVYVPTSPNPTSGFTVVVHRSKVLPSVMDLEAVTSFIVSVGVDLNQKEEFEKLAGLHLARNE